jgi:hypothetical protein
MRRREAKWKNVIHIIILGIPIRRLKNKKKLIIFLHPSKFLIDFNFNFKVGKKTFSCYFDDA